MGLFSIQRTQVHRQELQGGFAVFGIAGAQAVPQLLLLRGEGGACLGQHLVRRDVENAANFQDGFRPHVDSAALNV